MSADPAHGQEFVLRSIIRPVCLTLALFMEMASGGLPAHAEELNAFVSQVEGAKACWAARYPDDRLAADPKQTVAKMAMSLQFRRETYGYDDAPRQLLFYALDVEFRDGHKGSALGNCLPGAGNTISCGVECDGGGVDLTKSPDGSLIVDLARTGGIRLKYCGASSEAQALQASPSMSSFTLTALPAEQCPDVVLPDPDAGID